MRPILAGSLLPLALLSISAAASAQGAVWVVDDDGGPGVAFTSIQSAVDAAANGDTVLVKDGTYDEQVRVFSKELAIVAEQGATVLVLRGIRVQGLPPSGGLLLRGLEVPGSPTQPFADALVVSSSQGPVWVEDCTLRGSHVFSSAAAGAFLVDASSVTFLRCTLRGGTGVSETGGPARGGDGVQLVGGAAHLHGCVLEGHDATQGSGGGFGFPLQVPGGSGAYVTDGLLFASGSNFTGGKGADGFQSVFGCAVGSDGGAGIWLASAGATAQLLDSSSSGGPGGAPFGACAGGATGPATLVMGGTLTVLPGSHHGLVAASPVREGQASAATFTGEAGELVFLALGTAPEPGLLSPAWSGVLHVDGGSSLVLFLGVMPAGGTLSFLPTAGQLAPGLLATTLYLQPAFFGPAAPRLRLGAPSALTILDSSL